MTWVDALTAYLYGIEIVAVGVAVLLCISGLDDLLIDFVYWGRRAWRAMTVYRVHDRLDASALAHLTEKPIAIMVPAWQEAGVVARMAELAAGTLDYEHYHVFVGTYPNDPDTQREVDDVCARFRNVHKVVCTRPGPTSKADCLNNVLDAILQFERRVHLQFAGFVLHDAEDVISPLELRLFNYLVERKDLIQIPVYPFARRWSSFTSGHYLDEFAELHGKEIPVREALAGQVPSAGVGTCFSRRAILALLGDGDGIAFDVQSLTEDYDIGIRLRARGMTEIFVRFPAAAPAGHAAHASHDTVSTPARPREADLVCVREYFPDTFGSAVRQKSRWIAGIVYQGFRTHGWTGELGMDYFLWRDRKSAVNNFAVFAAMLIVLHAVALFAYHALVPDRPRFPQIFAGEDWFAALLAANAILLANRIAHRCYFVSAYYGAREGLLSIARIPWGAFINFAANCRAMVQVVGRGDAPRVAWGKTMHEFPVIGEPARTRRPLGRILVQQGAITEAQLEAALATISRGLKLGSALVHSGAISPEQLAAAVAEQSGVPWESVDTLDLRRDLLRELPEELALHYAVVPIREEGSTLVVGSESYVDPVSLAAMARKLARPVRYVVLPKGQVTVALRHWYVQHSAEDPRAPLQRAVRAGQIPEPQAEQLWREYVARQLLFAEILTSLGHLDTAALGSVLLRREQSSLSLGEYLVLHGIVAPAVLREALDLQHKLQGSMESLLERVGISVPARVRQEQPAYRRVV